MTSAGFGGQRRALLDQIVGAGGARIERRARHRKHLAALFGGHPRRDQRARAVRGLDHDDAERRAGDQAIAPRKIAGARHVAERHFGNRAAAFEQRAPADPHARADRSGHGRRPAPRPCRLSIAGAMRGLIDAARQPRDDDEAGVAEIARQLACEFQPGAGGVARADDGDHRPHQRVGRAAHAEQRRRIVERRQPRRIAGLAGRDQATPILSAGGEFGPRLVLAADAARTRGAAAPRQIGQPFQRGARAAEMIEQRAEGARPDIVGADQPQPVDPLGIGEVRWCWAFGRACGRSFAQPEIAINRCSASAAMAQPCACPVPRPSVKPVSSSQETPS